MIYIYNNLIEKTDSLRTYVYLGVVQNLPRHKPNAHDAYVLVLLKLPASKFCTTIRFHRDPPAKIFKELISLYCGKLSTTRCLRNGDSDVALVAYQIPLRYICKPLRKHPDRYAQFYDNRATEKYLTYGQSSKIQS